MKITHRLKAAARAALGRPVLPPADWYPFTAQVFWRSLYFAERLNSVSAVDGAIIECGVGVGQGLAMWSELARREGKDRQIWAFDSFEGFPKFAREDAQEVEHHFDHYHAYTVPFVHGALQRFGLSRAEIDGRFRIARGFMPDSFVLYDKGPIALLNLDLDLYESYRDALGFFWSYVAPGGVVMFDEYDRTLDIAKFPGAQKAINEFLEARGLRDALQKYPGTGNVFLQKPAAP